MDDSLGSFVDHYILLLAARFHASLYDVARADEGDTAAAADEPWQLVAACVQDALATPRTASERAALRHVDVTAFTAAVCRERARVLRWRMSTPGCAPKPPMATPSATDRAPPSTFDITQDSIKQQVADIFASVRAALPSAAADDDDDASDDNDETTRPRDTLVDFALRPDEDDVGARAVALARDNFLTKIHALQADFYATHHRWIDVPASVLETPSRRVCDEHRDPTASAASVSAQRAALLRELDGGVPREARRAVEALKTAVHLRRPSRPSQLSDRAIEEMYQSRTVTQSMSKSASASISPPAAARKDDGACGAERAAARRARWQVVEYSDNSSGEDDR